MANKMFIEVHTISCVATININHITHFFPRGKGDEEFTSIILSTGKTINAKEKSVEIQSKINALY
jgi:hypothetical protein